MVQRHRLARRERGHHGGRTSRLDAQHRGVGRPLGQVGGDPRDAAAATHRDHHQVRLVLELAKHFDGYRALAGMVRRSSNGGTSVAPVRSTSSRAAAAARS